MTDNKPLHPFYRYATLFVLLPLMLLFIVFYIPELLADKTTDLGDDITTIVMVLGTLGVPSFIVLFPKQIQNIKQSPTNKKMEEFGKKVDDFGEKKVLPVIGFFISVGFSILMFWLALLGLRALVRFLIY